MNIWYSTPAGNTCLIHYLISTVLSLVIGHKLLLARKFSLAIIQLLYWLYQIAACYYVTWHITYNQFLLLPNNNSANSHLISTYLIAYRETAASLQFVGPTYDEKLFWPAVITNYNALAANCSPYSPVNNHYSLAKPEECSWHLHTWTCERVPRFCLPVSPMGILWQSVTNLRENGCGNQECKPWRWCIR